MLKLLILSLLIVTPALARGSEAASQVDFGAPKSGYVQVNGKWSSKSLALYTQASIQGAFILAKAGDDSTFAPEAIDHLKNYVEILFNHTESSKS
jgi:TetR/AcrR family transcriptional repressor of nem operon